MQGAAFMNRRHGSGPVDHVAENGGGFFLFQHRARGYVGDQATAGIDDALQTFGCAGDRLLHIEPLGLAVAGEPLQPGSGEAAFLTCLLQPRVERPGGEETELSGAPHDLIRPGLEDGSRQAFVADRGNRIGVNGSAGDDQREAHVLIELAEQPHP